MTPDSSLSPPGPLIEAWKSLRPFASSTSGITWTDVGPTATSSSSSASLSGSVTHSRTVYPSWPTQAAGTLTVRSTTSSFVYGSSGASIVGASAIAGGSVASGLATTLPMELTTLPRPFTAPSTIGPTAPLATHRMPIESRTTVAANAALIGSGSARRRSTRR